jgi:flagellar hook assembly protein FlgD
LRSIAVTILVLGLLGGCAAAFAITEALKLERSPIAGPRFTRWFSPTCACERQTALLTFRLRRSERVDAVIVDDDGDAVRTLVLGMQHRRGRVSLVWDGLDDVGNVAPDGRYRLRVHLGRERRTILMPTRVFVDTTRPKIRMLGIEPDTFSPDGDGRNDRVRISYTADEPVSAVVIVNGTVAKEGHLHHEGAAVVTWNGEVQGVPQPPGRYTITLRAHDRAGNFSHQTAALDVVIRFVEVAPRSIVARRGGQLRFRVSADARAVSWRLLRRGRVFLSGSDAPGLVVADLPQRIRVGRYVLRVVEDGHTARADVRIARGRS